VRAARSDELEGTEENIELQSNDEEGQNRAESYVWPRDELTRLHADVGYERGCAVRMGYAMVSDRWAARGWRFGE